MVDEHRRPWRRELTRDTSETTDDAGVDATVDVPDRIVLRHALSLLRRRRRAILVLRFFEGLSVEETAAALGCSTGTLKSQTPVASRR